MSGVCHKSEDIERAVRLGVKDYILKPIDFEVLKNKLSFLVRDDKWNEWTIDKKKYNVNGNIYSNVTILSISEVTMTVQSTTEYKINSQLQVSFSIFTELGIPHLSVSVVKAMKKDNIYLTQLKFIGVGEKVLTNSAVVS
jgi:response regulator of citrate/malate metabolism